MTAVQELYEQKVSIMPEESAEEEAEAEASEENETVEE